MVPIPSLTVELQGSVPHGPARRAQQRQGQNGHVGSILQHGSPQQGAPDQGLQRVHRAHLGGARGGEKREQELVRGQTGFGWL